MMHVTEFIFQFSDTMVTKLFCFLIEIFIDQSTFCHSYCGFSAPQFNLQITVLIRKCYMHCEPLHHGNAFGEFALGVESPFIIWKMLIS